MDEPHMIRRSERNQTQKSTGCPIPSIEKSRKRRLIYSDKEQSSGCLRVGREGRTAEGRRELVGVSDTFSIFIVMAGPRECVKTHQDTYVVRQLCLHKAITR